MSQFPIITVDKDDWNKKVNACLMYTIPSEDEALPVLVQLQDILQRLHQYPLLQTIAEENVEFFFVQVFPIVCQKIIKSRYFKNQTVLQKANKILQLTACLLPRYIELIEKIPQMVQFLHSAFPDEFYFKTNNQLDHKYFPYLYFPLTEQQFEKTLQEGSLLDVMKFNIQNDKYCWTHGRVLSLDEQNIVIEYLNDYEFATKKFQRNSYYLAPYQSKCKTFEWRKSLKVGDVLDVMDSFGGWYNATVIEVQEEEDGRKKIEVTLKVYNENGNKVDETGRYFGFADYKEKFDAFAVQVAPYCSVAKEFCYQSSKSQFDTIDDQNDMQFLQYGGHIIYALPRKKNLSETLFKAVNKFGELGGFEKVLQKIEQKADLSMLSMYLKGISGIVPYLHRTIVTQQLERIQKLLQKNILSETNAYSKQKSEMLFNGLRSLLKRVKTLDVAYEYENNLKITLVEQNFQQQSLKKKLHGLNELKQIVKTLTYGSPRNKKIIEWIKTNHIFEKVYLINSHVQLIKKSESFFRYIINQNILEVQDLEKLLKMAQKGDYQTRISLYSLFQEVSHIFKKNHVNFLIDKILQSQPQLILNEDIDLLHELSRFSNYFPTQKVMEFFQKLILGQDIPVEINNYAIKKYSDMVSKNYEMKNYRKDVIKDLFTKIKTHDVTKITKILRFIFEGIGFGEWGKKDLSEMLTEQHFDNIIIQSIQTSLHNQANGTRIAEQCMDLLLVIYRLCSSYKIQIRTIQAIYEQVHTKPRLLEKFYMWCNEAFKCEQGIQVEQVSELQELFIKLFSVKKSQISQENIVCQKKQDIFQRLELLKSIFLEVNKRKGALSVSNIMREKQIGKEYKRKCPMKMLVFYETLLAFIYDVHNEAASEKSIQFFKDLYSAGQNSQQETKQFLFQNLEFLKHNSQQKPNVQTRKRILQTLRIIELIIDDSEKDCSTKIDSLIGKKKNYQVKLNFINSVSYATDTVKKMEVTIPVNYTLYDLRTHLAKELDINWKAVRIQGKKEFTQLMNCRTIKELGLNSFETLTVSRKPVPSQPQGEIIIDNEINPKAVRVFKVIFDTYSTDGKMTKNQCHDFTVKCLGSSSSPKFYEDKINNLFKQYDSNKDDLLQFEDFLSFYRTAAISRPSTVWSNLRSFGVLGNFKFNYEPSDQIKYEELPRNLMANMPEVYDLLFQLLREKQLASAAFELLQRLPVSKHMQEHILSIDSEQFNFEAMLATEDLYSFFYKLNIIEYLALSNELKSDEERDWVLRFTANQGFEKLLAKLFEFIDIYRGQSPNAKQKVHVQIIDILVDLLGEFLMRCFVTKPILQCTSLLLQDSNIDDKMEYLITGAFPKKQMQIQLPQNIEQTQQLETISKSTVLKRILDLFQSLWITVPSQIEEDANINPIYIQQILAMKLMTLIPLLQINEQPSDFISRMKTFISGVHDDKKLRKFYELVMCIAFYSEKGTGQNLIIQEMFKHLTMPNIVSQHFGVLAVLVAKYGVQTVNEQEIIGVLVRNILNSPNQLTIQGCSRLMLNFNLKNINQNEFQQIWQNCLFGSEKRAKKNSTREALYDLILKATAGKSQMTKYVISKTKSKIDECIQHMRITSCVEDNQRSLTGYAGLKNLGNICYINSMMQQLYTNKAFRYLILRINDYQPESLAEYKEKMYDDNILHQFQRIFGYLQLTTRADYVPAGFCLAYKPFGESVNVMIQQDVQEFVSMFFDQLENKIIDSPFKKVLDTFYGGKSTNLFNCHDCNNTKKVQENFYSITLEVKSSKTLSQSFNRYISGELISDFRCDFCNKKVDVSKKTRISKPPRTLIIHLQRIVFNLDTFINEKINTKHEFPMDLDLYPYSLAEFEKNKDITEEEEKELKQSMQYILRGIICHIGNAESGHYISYIKIANNKWLEFNDSIVTGFNPKDIDGECFGGVSSNFLDDFEWDRSSESSKSAYILLYEKVGETKIEAIVKSLEEKQIFLKQYTLKQLVQKVNLSHQKIHKKSQQDQSEQLSQSQSIKEAKLQEEMMRIAEQQKIRKKSKDLNIDPQKLESLKKQLDEEKKEIVIQIDPDISPYVPEKLKQEIIKDNEIHFFQRNLASPAFAKFFAHMLREPQACNEDTIKLLKKLTFGFWAKSTQFKDLLNTCSHFIEMEPEYADQLIFSNPQIVTYLIENPDSDVRTKIAEFLSTSLSHLIEKKDLKLKGEAGLDEKIVNFLDSLFFLLPTSVSKAWTKFGQYFQFWYQFSRKGQVELEYMVRKEVLKHFLDYFLDKKSPLKIYENKPQIGSKYANPNFSMLLKTVTYLISAILKSDKHQLSKQDYTLLIHFDSMEKFISENFQHLAAELVKEICKDNLYASEKVAIVLLKGLHKSTFNNVQAYLDVMHSYILIDDSYQILRMKWVLGRPVLHMSTISKQICAMNSYSFEERVYTYHSSISLEQASSLLDPIYELHKRAENFAMMSLKGALRLCIESDMVFKYIWSLPPPTLNYSSIYQFFLQFIDRYGQQAQRSHAFSQTGFNKQQLEAQVRSLYNILIQRWNNMSTTQKNSTQQTLNIENVKTLQPNKTEIQKQNQVLCQPQKTTQNQQEQPQQKNKQIISEQNHHQIQDKQMQLKKESIPTYFPVRLDFQEVEKYEMNGLQIVKHNSDLVSLLLEPTGRTNLSFKSGGIQKNYERLKEETWKTQQKSKVCGYLVHNISKNLLRLQTEEGTQLVKSGDYCWVWANQLVKVWQCERGGDWPSWSLYSLVEKM